MNIPMTLLEAAANLLERAPGRWTNRGYGLSNCTSCGAQRMVDYDNQKLIRETRESCSRSCPWRLLEEAVEQGKAA